MEQVPDNRHWVQVGRRESERVAELIRKKPQAASLLFSLVRHMDKRGAVAASQQTLAEIQGVSKVTIKRAVRTLREGNWIDVVRIGSTGGTYAYAVNGRVAWADRREKMPRFAHFQASVLAVESEQDEPVDGRPQLETVPTALPGEEPTYTGEGDDPPSQQSLEGLEPVLFRDQEGNEWEPDPETGELQQRLSGEAYQIDS